MNIINNIICRIKMELSLEKKSFCKQSINDKNNQNLKLNNYFRFFRLNSMVTWNEELLKHKFTCLILQQTLFDNVYDENISNFHY